MIQPEDIKKDIGTRPPHQRKVAGENYKGQHISWIVRFKNLYERGENNELFRVNSWPEDGMYPDIDFMVMKEDYPELKTLHENSLINVTGEIDEASQYKILLKNSLLKVMEENSVSLDNLKLAVQNHIPFQKSGFKWWETGWVQLVFLLSAIAGIAALFI